MKSRSFEEWLAEFVRYNQDGDVAQRFVTPEGHRLGSWVHSVRKGTYHLTVTQRQQLNEVGFRWKGELCCKRTFNEWLDDFIKYNKNGDVAQNFVTPDGYRLGNWVHGVRNGAYRLTVFQKQQLDEVGFKWRGMSYRRRTFEEWLEDFVKYNKDGDVARNFVTPEGHWLGMWVNNVRIRENRLPNEIKHRLEEVGFKWRGKRNRTFEEWLWDFIEYNQNGRVPQKYVTPTGHALGCWVYGVRNSIYKLTDEQKQILSEVGFDWSSGRDLPNHNFDEWMVEFKKYSQNGYVPVKFVTPEGYRLGLWAQNVRSGNYSLTEAQIEQLNEIGFRWKVQGCLKEKKVIESDVSSAKHRDFYEWLEDFKKYNKDGFVPIKFVTPEGYKLGRWAESVRRGRYKMTEERKKALDEVGFKWKVRNSQNR